MYVAGTDVAPRAFRNIEQPDQIDPNRRLEPGTPVVEAYLGGRHVFLARPEQRHGDFSAEGPSFTVPLTVSRMRRAYDIERDQATGPYRPSLVDDVPLDAQFSGLGIDVGEPKAPPAWKLAVGFGLAALVIWGSLRLVESRAYRGLA